MSLSVNAKNLIRTEVSLSSCVTMKIGGPADFFSEPKNIEELQSLLVWAKSNDLPFFILGNGSNCVFGDEGIHGLVVSMVHFENTRLSTSGSRVFAGSGVHLYRLAKYCAEQGLGGCEFLANIPGTVGGALAMNAGFSRTANNHEISDVVSCVYALNNKGEEIMLEKDDLCFSYRKSNLSDYVILAADFDLEFALKEDVQAEIKANFEFRNTKQDLSAASSGSIFKNPENFEFKAAQMIDQLGLKGYRIGGVQVSEKHANYFINCGQGSCEDLKSLIEYVRQKIEKHYGVRLETEVKIIEAI